MKYYIIICIWTGLLHKQTDIDTMYYYAARTAIAICTAWRKIVHFAVEGKRTLQTRVRGSVRGYTSISDIGALTVTVLVNESIGDVGSAINVL